MGLFGLTAVRIAKISLQAMEALADRITAR
jgi:hypothetical protein